LASRAEPVPATRPARATDDRQRLLAVGAIVVLAYIVAARLGFAVASAAEQVTTVWAPTGIGLAALLLWGPRLWPAVWLGAFIANTFSVAPPWTAIAIATGNTLESVIAVWALRRLSRFDPALGRVRDVVAFITIAAGAATTISATVGVATLCLAGEQSWSRFLELWWAWWLGDALGALVVAPVLLTTIRPWPWPFRIRPEAVLLVGGSMLVTHLVFGQVLGPSSAYHPLEYVIFPFVIAAAMRGGLPLTTMVVFGSSVIAIWNTVHGAGPFASAELHRSLVLLQAYMGVLAGTGLLLAAAIAERATGERRRAAAHAVGEVLIAAPDMVEAAPGILQAIGEHLEWQLSTLWLVDGRQQQMRCVAVWSAEPLRTASFVSATQGGEFARGVGQPGRVWAGQAAAWIEDVLLDANFPRAAFAREAGLRGAFAFPISIDEHVVGVIECFNRNVVTPDPDLLRTMATLGNQIGLFLARKREEAALIDAERQTSAIVETALDAVIGMDHRGLVTEFNPAAARMFGFDRDAVLGRELAELLIPPTLRHAHRDGLRRYLSSGVGHMIDRRFETTAWRADGHEFPVEVAIARVPGAEPPQFTGFVRDLTTRVRAEQEREQLLVREATARSEAESANRAKDDFLATLSHELRTPLNAIVGWTHMLRAGRMDELSSGRALDVIARNANLLAQLVADILDVSRIVTGGVHLEVRTFDLGAVIDAAVDAVRPSADAKRVELRVRLEPTAREIEGDPQRLQQVVWNLLVNAVKFTDAGGLVSIELNDLGEHVQIVVQDDGVGIDAGFLPHVFERFRQAESSPTRLHTGLGLGLAIVRHLVELHGGTVRAESPGAGQGSTFIVHLPRHQERT
jgi:PAS domain S-box-containing protein